MKRNMRRILTVVAIAIAAVGILWAWRAGNGNVYGGTRPYMDKLYQLQQTVASAIHAPGKLPAQFPPVVELASISQDVSGVFKSDPRTRHPKFAGLGADFAHRSRSLQQVWHPDKTAEARKAFEELVTACNACHQTVGGGPSIAP